MGNQTSQVVQSLQSEQRKVAIEQRLLASLPQTIDFESKHTFQICSHNKIIQLSSDIIATVATTSITVWNIYSHKLLSKVELDDNPSYVYKYDDYTIGYVVQDEDFYTVDWRTKKKKHIAILRGREYSIHPFGCFVVAGSGSIELICTKSKDNNIVQLTTSRSAKNCVITGNALCIAGSSAHIYRRKSMKQKSLLSEVATFTKMIPVVISPHRILFYSARHVMIIVDTAEATLHERYFEKGVQRVAAMGGSIVAILCASRNIVLYNVDTKEREVAMVARTEQVTGMFRSSTGFVLIYEDGEVQVFGKVANRLQRTESFADVLIHS